MESSRRQFIRTAAAAAAGLTAHALGASAAQSSAGAQRSAPPAPKASEFVFARLRYDSGDWDYNPKVASNVLNSIVEYTEIPVYKDEVVIPADSDELAAYPFLFMTGHKLVRFSEKARGNLVRFVDAGGFLFSDDCNHDVNGLYAKSFEEEMRRTFPGDAGTMPKLPDTHAIYRSFFRFPAGPPQTSHELNGWGDDIVHEYLRGVERRGRIGVLYSNKDYGCEWDYDWRNKRFFREDNTKFAVNLVVYAMT
jgi:Domain of unknown function (DUF4159)